MLALAWCGAAPGADSTTPDIGQGLSQLAGELHMPGLTRPVQVLRDRWGVAHIYAQSQHDLFFAQGVVAARTGSFRWSCGSEPNRAAQRDSWTKRPAARRERAGACLSGRPARGIRQLRCGCRADIESVHRRRKRTSSILSASGGSRLPAEFRLAGFAPEPWRPEDCLNRMATFSMTGNAVGGPSPQPAPFEKWVRSSPPSGWPPTLPCR